MKIRRFAAMAMASMMVLSMAACGGSQPAATTAAPAAPAATEAPKAEETKAEAAAETTAAAAEAAAAGGNIGVCIYKFDDAFMTTYRNALQEILEGKGYTVTFMDGKNDQAEQNNQINNFIAQGVDALIINPVMTSAADAIINTVKTADIPTVLINREPTADQMSAYDKLCYFPDLPMTKWDFSRYTPDFVTVAIGQNDAHIDGTDRLLTAEERERWLETYCTVLGDLMRKYPDAVFIVFLTILMHDPYWETLLDDACARMCSPRVRRFRFTRSGMATPGHPRIPEQCEMACELTEYIQGLIAEQAG